MKPKFIITISRQDNVLEQFEVRGFQVHRDECCTAIFIHHEDTEDETGLMDPLEACRQNGVRWK